MSSKRAATASASSSSASKRVKAEPSHSTDDDVKPDIKPKLEDHTPSVTAISLDWLKFTPPAELQALLLSACAGSPSTDALVAASLAKTAYLYEGDGEILDFKSEVVEIIALAGNWYEGEVWPEIVGKVEEIAARVSEESPLMVKLNALRALVEAIVGIDDQIGYNGSHAEFAEGESPDDMWRQLLLVINLMTDTQRRTHIDEALVQGLDSVIGTKRTRGLYGRQGRKGLGEAVTDDEEDSEDEEDEF